MWFGKFILFVVSLACAFAFAAPKAAAPVTVAKQVVTNVPNARFALGLSYVMWNEKLVLSQGNNSSNGVANYGGFAVDAQETWSKGHYVYGGTFTYGLGKASAGAFAPGMSFSDGNNRSWWVAQVSAFGLYRLNTLFSAGAGILERYRSTDWTSSDATLTTTPTANLQPGFQLLLRWTFAGDLSFTQIFAPLDFQGSTLWQWSLHYSF